ncbi:MAG: oligopeptide/dipeptide ABC transporter ATPase [Promethearchaeota archaeon CR_4]|nr:MAG: oligopeptide/dipeptide ABC transporter ATPase [Candidatus Lokiarchaeota archaeon CR_4]
MEPKTDTVNPDIAAEEQINKTNGLLLKIKDLRTYFYTEEGIVKAVDGVSFDINVNESIGLVGETGCGKSVTALSIIRLVREPGKIESGTIELKGEDLVSLPEEKMRKHRGNDITMIFQDPLNSLNPVLKIGDQISEVFLIHQNERLRSMYNLLPVRDEAKEKAKGEKQEKVRKEKEEKKRVKREIEEKICLEKGEREWKKWEKKEKARKEKEEKEKKKQENEEKIRRENKYKKVTRQLRKAALNESMKLITQVGIPDAIEIINRYPFELSGGMRQRVMIAMALACNPALLIADEPTTALDVTIEAQILELMKELKKKYQTSILLITHDLGIIADFCERVAVMYAGNIVEYAEVNTLFAEPLHPYTKGLMNAIPNIQKRGEKLHIIRGSVPDLIYTPSGCRFHPRCDYRLECCDKVVPRYREIKDKYFVSCHLYDPEFQNSPKFIWNGDEMNRSKQV